VAGARGGWWWAFLWGAGLRQAAQPSISIEQPDKHLSLSDERFGGTFRRHLRCDKQAWVTRFPACAAVLAKTRPT